ncbi:hypothetical protein CoNPh26_CDS0072 [Staphylococcus phage S-CoN_Ph26]|nr:hypothetical protein CoNPh26_CDS0072 [Staphylococcus phage S-CoN_Ph26]
MLNQVLKDVENVKEESRYHNLKLDNPKKKLYRVNL